MGKTKSIAVHFITQYFKNIWTVFIYQRKCDIMGIVQ